MDKYFEALERSKGQLCKSILDQISFDETADVLEKGKKAPVGEIRDWNGVKMQKISPSKWAPVKQGSGKQATSEESGSKGTKKGDIIIGTTEGGLKVKGPVVSIEGNYFEIKGTGNNSYLVPVSSARNISKEERDIKEKESKREAIEDKVVEIKEQLDSIWNSPEMEDWYGEHPEYTGEDYPDEFKDRILELEGELGEWIQKLNDFDSK